MMKKFLPLLVVTIFIFGGFGALAESYEKTRIKNTSFQHDLDVEIEGGLFYVTVTYTNNNYYPVEVDNISINLDATLLVTGGYSPYPLDPPIEMQPGESLTFKSKFVFGIGEIFIAAHYRPTDFQWKYEETSGFLLFFAIIIE